MLRRILGITKKTSHTYTCIHTWGAASLSHVSFIKLFYSLESLQVPPMSWLIKPLTAVCPHGLFYFLCTCPQHLPNQSLSPLPAATGADWYIGDQQHGVYQPVQPGDAAQAPGPGYLWLHQEPLQRLRQRHRHHQVGLPVENEQGFVVKLQQRLNTLSIASSGHRGVFVVAIGSCSEYTEQYTVPSIQPSIQLIYSKLSMNYHS